MGKVCQDSQSSIHITDSGSSKEAGSAVKNQACGAYTPPVGAVLQVFICRNLRLGRAI
jgi:hypothetical protein